MHALAMASPNAIVTVVEDVGAKLRGQASRAMGVTKLTSAAFASELSARPVMEMIRTPKALSAGRIVRSSSDSPEKEMPELPGVPSTQISSELDAQITL